MFRSYVMIENLRLHTAVVNPVLIWLTKGSLSDTESSLVREINFSASTVSALKCFKPLSWDFLTAALLCATFFFSMCKLGLRSFSVKTFPHSVIFIASNAFLLAETSFETITIRSHFQQFEVRLWTNTGDSSALNIVRTGNFNYGSIVECGFPIFFPRQISFHPSFNFFKRVILSNLS